MSSGPAAPLARLRSWRTWVLVVVLPLCAWLTVDSAVDGAWREALRSAALGVWLTVVVVEPQGRGRTWPSTEDGRRAARRVLGVVALLLVAVAVAALVVDGWPLAAAALMLAGAAAVARPRGPGAAAQVA